MKNLIIASTFLFLFFAGCHKNDSTLSVDFDLDEVFDNKYNTISRLNSADFNLTVIELLEDSRCPQNANCIWGGQVKLKLRIINNGVKSFHEITFLGNSTNDLLVDGYFIQKINVTPDVQIDEVIDLEDYTFSFIVTEQ